MPEKAKNNCFHDYILAVTRNKGMSLTQLRELIEEYPNPDTEETKIARQWTWEISKRPARKIGKRKNIIELAAKVLGEPMSKLAFFAGLNPWSDRLGMIEQGAIWEFIEAIVTAKENGLGKPPVTRYMELCNTLFGGAKVEVTVSNEEMAALLRGEDEED